MDRFFRCFCCCCIGTNALHCEDSKDDLLQTPLRKNAEHNNESPASKKMSVMAGDGCKTDFMICPRRVASGKAGHKPEWSSGRNVSKASSSCPQLTVEEPTSINTSLDEEPNCEKNSDQKGHKSHRLTRLDEESGSTSASSSRQQYQKQTGDSRSLLTKTYSFRRMLSFRGSIRSRDSSESMQSGNFRQGNDSPGEENQHRPLQFSFLGQIYVQKSMKKQHNRRHSSLRWNRQHSGGTITSNPFPLDSGVAENRFEADEDEDENPKNLP